MGKSPATYLLARSTNSALTAASRPPWERMDSIPISRRGIALKGGACSCAVAVACWPGTGDGGNGGCIATLMQPPPPAGLMRIGGGSAAVEGLLLAWGLLSCAKANAPTISSIPPAPTSRPSSNANARCTRRAAATRESTRSTTSSDAWLSLSPDGASSSRCRAGLRSTLSLSGSRASSATRGLRRVLSRE